MVRRYVLSGLVGGTHSSAWSGRGRAGLLAAVKGAARSKPGKQRLAWDQLGARAAMCNGCYLEEEVVDFEQQLHAADEQALRQGRRQGGLACGGVLAPQTHPANALCNYTPALHKAGLQGICQAMQVQMWRRLPPLLPLSLLHLTCRQRLGLEKTCHSKLSQE